MMAISASILVFISASSFMILSVSVQHVNTLKAPQDVKVQQIWPGQVQAVWSHDNLRNVIFTVHYRAEGSVGAWESKTVSEQSVVVLEGLTAHTNYSIKVAALKGNQLMMSESVYIKVREGVPWSPSDLVFARDNKSSISYQLDWKTRNPGNVDGYLILVAYGNETVAIETSHTTYRFDGVLPEKAKYKIKVYAFNTVGRSEPSIITVDPLLAANKRTVKYMNTDEPQYQPEYPQEMLLYILIPIGVVLLAALILLIIVVAVKRHREHDDDSAVYDEIAVQEPFMRAKNLPPVNPVSPPPAAAETRNCAVQVSDDMPIGDRLYNYGIVTPQRQNDLNQPNPSNGLYCTTPLTQPNDTPRCRLKKSDSISSYTRYDDIDTDCEDYIHNSSDDVLQTSHLDIPRTGVRFSPHLSDRKLLSKRIPIFPIENERIYCVVDIDRYKLNPSDIENDHHLSSPVY